MSHEQAFPLYLNLRSPNFDSDVDTIVDSLGSPRVGGGLFRWGRIIDSKTRKLNLFFDPTELAAVSPALAKGYYSAGSYEGRYFEDDNDLWVEGDLKPEDQRNIKYYEPDHEALTALSFVAHKRTRQRVAQVETDVATLKTDVTRASMLQTLGINEYNNETAAANSGLGQGEVYWDTTLNRMRAVT